MQSAPLPSDSTRGQILELTQIIPMEGQRIQHYTGPQEDDVDYSGVTAGALPQWAPVTPAPVQRQQIDGAAADTVGRYFDRSHGSLP